MSDEHSSGAAREERPKSWLEKIGQILQSEPKDKEDLRQVIEEAQDRNLLDNDAFDMIKGVMDVTEMRVREVMIPRSHMIVVERDAPLKEFLPVIIESAHSRFPVIGDNRDEVLGILLAKDLLPYVSSESDEFNIRDLLRPVLFIPESKRLNVLLKEFRTSRNHLAVVVDEYGGVAGLVTIEDVLEQIVGEIEDEYDIDEDDVDIYALGDGRYMVQALTEVEDFNEYFSSHLNEDGEFETISGLVMKEIGHLPEKGEIIELGGFVFTVQRADKRRVHQFEVTQINTEDTSAEVEE
jgi:magnesium and cobalt transporter